ncbi:MAG: DNA primase [Pontiellaceae bacterium]
MALIPKETIEEIRSRSNIVDVITAYLPELRRRGSTHKCCCPFHKEKTPSFTVNDERQIYHCFGCGAGGDVFRFVQDYEKVDFIGAVQLLADRVGVEVVFEGGRREDQTGKDVLLKLQSEAAAYYHRILMQGREGEMARRYLQERDLPVEMMKAFQIGFAPDEWEGLLSRALKKGYEVTDLERAGLAVPSERSGKESHYDRFRGRVMFPICDPMGRVIGFSGRIMNRADRGAKYVNSPETLIFKKSQVLFAFDQARKAIVERRQAIIVEGQIDAIRCHQAGLTHVAASQGTALTEQHARLIKRYTDEVILVFDADAAGVKAALATASLFTTEELSVRVATLPEKTDPDSLIRDQGVEVFERLLNEAPGALAYLIEQQQAAENQTTEAGRLRVVKEVLAFIRPVRSATRQDSLLREAADRLNLSEDALKYDLNQHAKPVMRKPVESELSSAPAKAVVFPKEETELLELLVHHHQVVQPLIKQYLPSSFFQDPACRTLVESLMEKEPDFLVRHLNEFEEELRQCLTQVQIGLSKIFDSEVSEQTLAQKYILLFWQRELERELNDREAMQALSGAERYIHQTRLKQDLGMLKAGWDKAVLMIDSRLQPLSDETR